MSISTILVNYLETISKTTSTTCCGLFIVDKQQNIKQILDELKSNKNCNIDYRECTVFYKHIRCHITCFREVLKFMQYGFLCYADNISDEQKKILISRLRQEPFIAIEYWGAYEFT